MPANPSSGARDTSPKRPAGASAASIKAPSMKEAAPKPKAEASDYEVEQDEYAMVSADRLNDIGDDNQEALEIEEEPLGNDVIIKPSWFERPFFALAYGMIKDYESSVWLILFFNLFTDLQLFSFSWRTELVQSGIVRWVFNPQTAFVDFVPIAAHVIVWIVILALVASAVYCQLSMSTGRMRFIFPLHLLRFLTLIATTSFFVPALQIYMKSLNCVTNVPAFGGAKCFDSEHIGWFASAAVGSCILVFYAVVMTLLYFDSSASARSGKRNGRVDALYLLIRAALVLTESLSSGIVAAGVNTGLLGLLMIVFVDQQPYYSPLLNNMRAASFMGAFALAVSSVVYFAIGASSPIGFIGGGMGVICAVVLGGYFINHAFVKARFAKVLAGLKRFDLVVKATLTADRPPVENIEQVRQSYLDLLYSSPIDITKRTAIIEKISVFPGPQWVEISARFLQRSYMDKDAVTLANRLLEVGSMQFPSYGSVHIAYLNYIRSYLTILKGKERQHMSMMMRKCKLRFDHRFLAYVHQQTLNQRAQITSGDGDAQVTSYIEYQQMESSVTKYHVDTLLELKEFWQAVRSESNEYVLSLKLNRIGELNNKTLKLYQKFVERFPNSRNILLLFSRFHTTISADAEQATLYKNMAEDLDSEEQEIEMAKRTGGADDDAEKKSAAQSRGSSVGSKESKLIKARRNLLYNRLQMPVTDFLRRVNFASVLFLTVLIVTVVISYMNVNNTAASLDQLGLAVIGRRLIHKIYSDVRRISLASELDDKKSFEFYMASLKKTQRDWKGAVSPYLDKKGLDSNELPLYFWDGVTQQFGVRYYNTYKAGARTMEVVDAITDYDNANYTLLMSWYKNRANTTNNPSFRYLYDNLDTIYLLFEMNAGVVTQSYTNDVSSQLIILSILYAALLLVFVIGGFILPNQYLGACFNFQDKVLGLFRKVPRSLVTQFINEIEEEVEVINGGDVDRHMGKINTTSNMKAEGSAGSRLTLKWQYIVLGLLVLAAVPYMYYVIYNHLSSTQLVPYVFDLSNIRRCDMPQRIYAMAQDGYANDTITHRPGQAIAKMTAAINRMEYLHDFVDRALAPFLVDTSTLLYRVLVAGGCFLEPASKCDTEVRPEFGYTKTILKSGVNHRILLTFDTGRHWIKLKDFSKGMFDIYLLLLEQIANDLRDAYQLLVRDGVLGVVKGSIDNSVLLLFILMGAMVVLSVLAYFVGFFTTARTFTWNNKQLVSLLYFVPTAERMKIQEMHTFIESGGAILN